MRAFLVEEDARGFRAGLADATPEPTDPDDVLVEVDYSGVNFKDSLVARPGSRVRRSARVVGGIDAAGTVVASRDPAFPVGAQVAVHGGDLGVARDGGFAEMVYAPARYLNVLPAGLSPRDAMTVGTAGFTAMASVLALESHGLGPGAQVLVTGATGGVGSMAVTFLAGRGYSVTASTGSPAEATWLHERGARRVISRTDVADHAERVLGSERWDAAVDCIGGVTLPQILRSLRYGGAVAASGLVAGADLHTTVYPFILRGVALLGVDAVEMGVAGRLRVWAAVAQAAARLDLGPLLDHEASLEDLPAALAAISAGTTRGRVLVSPRA